MNPIRRQAEADQGQKYVEETYPYHWRRIYEHLVKAGFTEEQAMDLLKLYVDGVLKMRVPVAMRTDGT